MEEAGCSLGLSQALPSWGSPTGPENPCPGRLSPGSHWGVFSCAQQSFDPWPLLRAEDVTVSRTDVVPGCRVAAWWGHRHSVSSRKAAPAPLGVFAGPAGSQGWDGVERMWGGCYQTELRPARLSAAKPINRQWVVVKERTAFILQAPSKENGQLALKRPKLPDGFQGRGFQGQHLW